MTCLGFFAFLSILLIGIGVDECIDFIAKKALKLSILHWLHEAMPRLQMKSNIMISANLRLISFVLIICCKPTKQLRDHS